jgi:hypothetical protein
MLNPKDIIERAEEELNDAITSDPDLEEYKYLLATDAPLPIVYSWLRRHPDVISNPNLFIYTAISESPLTVPLLSTLIRLGADLNATNSSGQTALHFLARSVNRPSDSHRYEALLYLRACGAAQLPDKEGLTPIHHAIHGQQPSKIHALLRFPGVNMAETPQGETVLQFAKSQGDGDYGPVLNTVLKFRLPDDLFDDRSQHFLGPIPKFNASELVAIINDEESNAESKRWAYYNLLAKTDVKTLEDLLPTLRTIGEYQLDSNDLLIAIHEGRKDILDWLLNTKQIDLGQFKESFLQMLQTAGVAGNQLTLLDLLTAPKTDGGYGLSPDTRMGGYSRAFASMSVAMLRKLFNPNAGFFFAETAPGPNARGLVPRLIETNRRDLLQALLTPITNGGLGVEVTARDIQGFQDDYFEPHAQQPSHFSFKDGESNVDPKYYYTLCLVYFNQLVVKNGCEVACAWLADTITKSPYPKEGMAMAMLPIFKALLTEYLARQDHLDPVVAAQNKKDAETLANLIEDYMPGAADLVLARHYRNENDLGEAFQLCNQCLTNKYMSQDEKHEAGIMLAEMIYAGAVVLNNDGSLNEKQTRAQAIPNNKEGSQLERLLIEKQDAQALEQRAIQAYEYLHGNPTPVAAQLRARLDNTLASKAVSQTAASTLDQTPTEQSDDQAAASTALWHPSACQQFMRYYAQRRNLDMLTNDSYLASSNHSYSASPRQAPSPPRTDTARTVTPPVGSEAAALRGHGVFSKPPKKSEEKPVVADTSLKPPASADGTPVSPPTLPGKG